MIVNPFTQKVSQTKLDAEKNSILQTYAAQSTQERLHNFVSFSYVVLGFTTLVSIITEGAFLYLILDRIVDSLFWKWVITIQGVIIIEVLKLVVGPVWYRSLFMGWIRQGRQYILPFTVLSLLVFIGFGGSAYLSINGSPVTVENVAKKVAEPDLPIIDLQAIHSRYDAQIAEQLSIQEEAKGMTWRGSIVRDGRNLLLASQATVNEIESRRTLEIEQAIIQNEQVQAEYAVNVATYSSWFKSIGGICELITFLLIGFRMYYEKNVYLENFQQGQQSTGNLPSGSVQIPTQVSPFNPQHNSIPYTRPKIGFRTSASAETLPENRSAETVSDLSEQQNTLPHTTVQNTLIKTVPDQRVIEHKGKWYKRKDVENMLATYERRLNNYKQKVISGNATSRTRNGIKNCTTKIAYWQGRLTEFNEVAI